MPALRGAIKALDTLKKSDLVEVKAMTKPPLPVKITMEAVCIMFKVKPAKIKNPDGFGKIDDYWESAKKKLLNLGPKLLVKMKEYPRDDIPVSVITKVKGYIDNPDFQPERVEKGSLAAAGMCKWVHALVVYDKVAKVVAPKKQKLREAEAIVKEYTEKLNVKLAELAEVENNLKKLGEQLHTKKTEKEKFAQQVKQTELRLKRADQLTSGLSSERERWEINSQKLDGDLKNLLGDVLLSAGVVAYVDVCLLFERVFFVSLSTSLSLFLV